MKSKENNKLMNEIEAELSAKLISNMRPKEMKYLNRQFKASSLKEDDEFFYFEGYTAVFGNVDWGDDVILQGAFKKSLENGRRIRLCEQHDITKVRGLIDEAKEDNYGLFIKGRIPKENTECKNLGVLLKIGAIDEMSIGYDIPEGGMSYDKTGEVRYLKELDLWEASFVTFAMNPLAKVTSVKSLNINKDLPIASQDTKWDKYKALERIKVWSNVSDIANDKYKEAFLFYDEKNANLLESYKLQICDVIDGKLTVIPRAIFSASSSIIQDKNISEEEKEKIKSILSEYYKKMDLSPSWDSSETKSQAMIDNILSIKDVNEFLRIRGLNNTERTGIIAKIKKFQSESDPCKKVEEETKCNTENLIKELQTMSDSIKKIVENL